MIDLKKRNESLFEEFEIDEKKLVKGTTVDNCGRSTNEGKPISSHLTLKFEARNSSEAAKVTALKYFVSLEQDVEDKYVWRVTLLRNY
jgi:hypothetical protein